MGSSAPPPATIDLVDSYARLRADMAEIVLADPQTGPFAEATVILRDGKRTARGTATFVDDHRGRRVVGTVRRDALRDGTWTIAVESGDEPAQIDARLLVQGRRPLVLLWGAKGMPSMTPIPHGRPAAGRRAATVAGKALDRALAPLPAERAARIRSTARRVARRVLR
jgi:hypothetical protein